MSIAELREPRKFLKRGDGDVKTSLVYGRREFHEWIEATCQAMGITKSEFWGIAVQVLAEKAGCGPAPPRL